MVTIAVANQKGGVGKTTTVANLAVALSRLDRSLKILVVDLDTQCNCTSIFCKDELEPERTVVELFNTRFFKEKPSQIIQFTRFQNIHVLPSHASLVDKGYVVGNLIKAHERLKMFLENVSYDYVLIDTPPSLGIFSLNGLLAADYLLATTVLEKFSISGLESLFATLEAVQEANNEKPFLLGTLPVMVDKRTKSHNFYMEKLPATVALNFLDKYAISVNAPISTATMNHQTIFEYDATAKSKYQYTNLAKWMLKTIPNTEKTHEQTKV